MPVYPTLYQHHYRLTLIDITSIDIHVPRVLVSHGPQVFISNHLITYPRPVNPLIATGVNGNPMDVGYTDRVNWEYSCRVTNGFCTIGYVIPHQYILTVSTCI